jgi:hypothetical protein
MLRVVMYYGNVSKTPHGAERRSTDPMNEITITLPAIDETVIANLDAMTSQASATETEALKAIREKYAILARQNGYIRIAHWSVSNSNWSASNDVHYERKGRKVRALLAFDNFGSTNSDQNSGTYEGDKLYLLESGEWLRIERRGIWSQWQGSPDQWGCGVSAQTSEADEYDQDDSGGDIRVVTDAEVGCEYPLSGIVEELAKSLKTLAEKLPQRMVKVQQRVSLAQQLLEGLK